MEVAALLVAWVRPPEKVNCGPLKVPAAKARGAVFWMINWLPATKEVMSWVVSLNTVPFATVWVPRSAISPAPR